MMTVYSNLMQQQREPTTARAHQFCGGVCGWRSFQQHQR
jgi:hypothetical protein